MQNVCVHFFFLKVEFCIPESDVLKTYDDEFPPLEKLVSKKHSQKVLEATEKKHQSCIEETSAENKLDVENSEEMLPKVRLRHWLTYLKGKQIKMYNKKLLL